MASDSGAAAADSELKPLWFVVKKNKNKALVFGCLVFWSVCFATYAYQCLGGFVHWPYWCLFHLLCTAPYSIPMIIGWPPGESPPSLPVKLFLFSVGLCIPLFTTDFTITVSSGDRLVDRIYAFFAFFSLDLWGCATIASLTRPKYTLYWQLLGLVFCLAFSSVKGFEGGNAINPVWCKIVMCCSAVAVAALSTVYLYLRRRRLVSVETPTVAFSRCFV